MMAFSAAIPFFFFLILFLFGFYSNVNAVINVHIVSHTHDDVGWLKTVDQYYYGANNSIQHAGVQYILDSVIPALQANPDRKFIYVEIAFFQRWWHQQSDAMKHIVKGLVNNGQLEFVNGGICMHDEAAAHYSDMIDQTTTGHKFLLDTFGVIPHIGWQIDPFGHSSTQAALLSGEVGFDALFFGRIDYQDHKLRIDSKSLEFIWQASSSLNANETSIFTSVATSGNYGPPDSFCFDLLCSDDPIKDDKRLHDYNIDSKINDFIQAINKEASIHQGNNIMFQMGSDFQYENANEWYKNLDKLIKYTNERGNGAVNVFYSTPSQYIKARHLENIQWPSKTDDFFPYADGPHQMWTGYFTSRPALKHYIRVASSLLNSIRQIEALTGGDGSATNLLAENVAITQHHDGVSGTSKQHVAYDYAQRLSEGSDVALSFVSKALNNLTLKTMDDDEEENNSNNINNNKGAFNYNVCLLSNISICSLSQSSSSFSVLLYNPLIRSRTELIRIPINADSASVKDSSGNSILSQIIPLFNTAATTKDSASHTLYFIANIPPLGYATYNIITAYNNNNNIKKNHHHRHNNNNIKFDSVYTKPKLIKKNQADPVIIQNTKTRLIFDPSSGLLTTMEDIKNELSVKVTQEFLYYESYANNTVTYENSGAYLFRPASQDPLSINTSPIQLSIIDGPIIKEIRQIYSVSWIRQIIRLISVPIDYSEVTEFEWTVGSIPIDDNWGKEIITRFTTDIQSNSAYYTDSNGREILKRIRNYRPTWPLEQTEPVAGNYYPINSLLSIRDNKSSLNIIPDRAQGGGSINDGQIEIMIHRRLLNDDARGVGEPLNETDGITPYPDAQRLGKGLIINGKHKIFISPPDKAAAIYRPVAHRVIAPIQSFYASSLINNNNNNVNTNDNNHLLIRSASSYLELPSNIELLTLSPLPNNYWLLRFVHLYEINEDNKLSSTVTIDIGPLFSNYGWKIDTIEERSLTGNQKYDGMQRLLFQSNINPNAPTIDERKSTLVGTSITIAPMQIKTILVKVIKQ